MKSFFSEKRGQKLGCVLYTGAHYTRVNTVKLGHSYLKLLDTSVENFEIREISLAGGGDFWPEMKAYLL